MITARMDSNTLEVRIPRGEELPLDGIHQLEERGRADGSCWNINVTAPATQPFPEGWIVVGTNGLFPIRQFKVRRSSDGYAAGVHHNPKFGVR
jgi:hypothetical protein